MKITLTAPWRVAFPGEVYPRTLAPGDHDVPDEVAETAYQEGRAFRGKARPAPENKDLGAAPRNKSSSGAGPASRKSKSKGSKDSTS